MQAKQSYFELGENQLKLQRCNTLVDSMPVEYQLSWHTVTLSSSACQVGKINIDEIKYKMKESRLIASPVKKI